MTTLAEYADSRELFVHLTLRELRGKYKRSTLGWAWSLLNPLATMVIFTLVFRFFFRIEPPRGDPSGLQNFALFLLCALLPWNFLVSSVFGSIGTLVGNGNLVKKTYFPRELLVLSQVASQVVSFLLELLLLAVVLFIAGNVVLPFVPLVLFLVLLLALFSAGVGLALSVFNVFFRDVQHLTNILFQAWFYLSPVVYPISIVPERATAFGREIAVRSLYDLNPVVHFARAFRDTLYELRWPPLSTMAYLTVVSIVVFALGMAIFARLEGRLAEEL